MASLFRKQLYIVYFCCIDPDGAYATADCVTEALTQTQAKSQVISAAKLQGFSRIEITDCCLATKDDIERVTQLAEAEMSEAPGGISLH